MKKGLLRPIMLTAGFLAVIVILCSQSFFAPKNSEVAKAKSSTEHAADQKSDTLIVPGDAIPGHSVQIDDSSAFREITTIFESEEEPDLPPVPAERIGHLFEVLFRTVIAPNAP
jgi:hypothetical protein